MIIGIGGWERCFKTGLGAMIATQGIYNEFGGGIKYNIKQGFGNLSLFETPFPWTYLKNRDLVDRIRLTNEEHITDTLFFIDEADEVFNPRNYSMRDQISNLKGIGQHSKLRNVYVYTYQLGQPDDGLLGVDKILRSNTRIEFEMRLFDPESCSAIYHMKSYMLPGLPVIEGVLTNLDQYFKYWNTLQPVI